MFVLSLLVCLVELVLLVSYPVSVEQSVKFLFYMDHMSLIVKILLVLVFIIYITLVYLTMSSDRIFRGEFFLLLLIYLLFSFLGLMAYDLMLLFLLIEGLSIILYLLILFGKYAKLVVEAGIKYFILSVLSSIFFLFGLSLIYLSFGTLNYTSLSLLVADGDIGFFAYVGFVFVVVGLLFKLGVVPFHFWVPDVYEGSATIITLFLASINKVVFFFFFFKLLVSFPLVFLHFSIFFLGFGLLSLFVGTFIGLYQTDVKRLIAYSSIVVMGYMFVSIGLFSFVGFVSFFFFLSVYIVTLFGLFSVILLIRR